MTKTTMLAGLLVALGTGTASAGGQAGSLGVGAEYAITSINFGVPGMGGGSLALGGASVNYDAGDFHAGGFLLFADGEGADNTDIGLGGRFYYHVHSSAMSDFGLGGNLAYLSLDTPFDRAAFMVLEPGFQLRAFVTPNVALTFSGGIAIGLLDAEGVALGAQATGSAGVHYYFF